MPPAIAYRPAAGPSSCNWPVDSAWGRSRSSAAASWKSRRRWNWSSSPAATRRSRRGWNRLHAPPRHLLHVFGFTTQMDELMAAADLVVSKPGGLTTSEALARGTPMAIVNPIPGQESRNSDYLLENGAAIKINNVATLPYKLEQLLGTPGRLAQLAANAQRLGRPQAAFDVARTAPAMAGIGLRAPP